MQFAEALNTNAWLMIYNRRKSIKHEFPNPLTHKSTRRRTAPTTPSPACPNLALPKATSLPQFSSPLHNTKPRIPLIENLHHQYQHTSTSLPLSPKIKDKSQENSPHKHPSTMYPQKYQSSNPPYSEFHHSSSHCPHPRTQGPPY